MLQTELAWAAGFFDGEGCTSIAKGAGKGGPFISLRVAQAGKYAPETLGRFQKALGLGKVRGPYILESRRHLNRKEEYQWAATSFEHAQAAIAMLWKYLSGQKREQAKEALAVMKAKHDDPEYRYHVDLP